MFIQQWEMAIRLGMEIHVQGDFNLNFLDFSNQDHVSNTSQSFRLRSLLCSLKDKIIPHGFCQLVQGVTRIWPGAESTLLDHHWTNHPEKVSFVHEYFQGASDHKMICITRTTKKVISKARIIKKTTFKNFDPEIFIEAVSKPSWLDVYDIDTAVNLVSTKLNNILDEMAPVKVIQVRSHYALWMSEET